MCFIYADQALSVIAVREPSRPVSMCTEKQPPTYCLHPQQEGHFPGDKSQMTEDITRTNGPPLLHL